MRLDDTYWQRLTPPPAINGHIARRYLLTARGNLAVLDWDGDFLKQFVEKTGHAGGYVGLGKSFEGLSRMAAYLRDEKLLELRRHVLMALESAQTRDGYLGIFPPPLRVHAVWDAHELSYILMALTADWNLFGEAGSLRMARRLAHYLLRRIPHMKSRNQKSYPELVTLGLDRALIALYHATGNRDYIEFVQKHLRLPEWQLDIVVGRHGVIAGHAYAWMVHCLAQLDLFAVTGDRRLLRQTQKLLCHLFENDGLLITGATGLDECWNTAQTGEGHVGETCATAYLIRLAETLSRMTGLGCHADWCERSLYNALFAAQSPDGRKLRYYTPFQGERVYWGRDTYCCPGNFRRIVSDLPWMIFHQRMDVLRVNLYEASRTRVIMDGNIPVDVVLDAKYPDTGEITLKIKPARPVTFEIRLRIPGWCKRYELQVNGKKSGAACVDGYVGVQREWRSGDRLELNLEMPWRLVKGTGSQAGRAAVMRGPLVYCAAPADNPAFSPADFTRITVDPKTCQAAPGRRDAPFGPAGRIKAAQTDPYTGKPRRGWLNLTTFPNPAGQSVYFKS